jgi:hypothetical protein
MARQSDDNVVIEDARITYLNFRGEGGQFNREGDRNFAVILEPEVARKMEADGWNIKWRAAREEGEEDTPILSVSVNYSNRPPRIVMISSKGRTHLGEDLVEMLDYVDRELVDLVIRPYDWGPINGKSGRKAYLRTMFITIYEDPIELKYAEMMKKPLAIEADEVVDAEIIEEEYPRQIGR